MGEETYGLPQHVGRIDVRFAERRKLREGTAPIGASEERRGERNLTPFRSLVSGHPAHQVYNFIILNEL